MKAGLLQVQERGDLPGSEASLSPPVDTQGHPVQFRVLSSIPGLHWILEAVLSPTPISGFITTKPQYPWGRG